MAAKHPPRVEIHQDFLICTVCFEQFKNPKILPCHHSFCKECLLNLVDKKKRIECPICREVSRLPIGGVSELTASFYINSILESVEKQKQEETSGGCNSCMQGAQTNRCVDCGLNICDICTVAHRNIPTTKDHCVLTLKEYDTAKSTDPSLYCTTHEGNELRFYCETCQAPCCFTCTENEHKPPSHKYKDLNAAAKECAQKLEIQVNLLRKKAKEIDECKRRMSENIQLCNDLYTEQEESIKKHVRAMLATLTINLQSEESKLLDILKIKYDHAKENHQKENDKLQSKGELVNNTLLTVENLLRQENNPQILTTYTETLKCIRQLVAMDVVPRRKRDGFPKFTPHTKTLQGSIGEINTPEVKHKTDTNKRKNSKTKRSRDWTTRLDALSTISIKTARLPQVVRLRDQLDIAIEATRSKVVSCKDLQAELLEPNGRTRLLPVVHTDSSAGSKETYRVTIKGCIAGRQLLSIKIGDHHIIGSPTCIDVRPAWQQEKAFGKQGDKPSEFSTPCGVTVNKDNNIVVADRENNRLQILKMDTGQCVKIIQCSGLGKPFKPFDIAILNDLYFVADIKNNRVIVCDDDNKVVQCFGQDYLKYPWGIAINTANSIVYVVNSGQHSIAMFTAHDGEYVKSFGSKGSGPGQMNYPTYITINSQGHVMVSDWGNYRIQVFNADGQFLFTFCSRDSQRGQADKPAGLAVDANDNIYVSFDSGNQGLLKYDSQGKFICNVGDANCGVAVTNDAPCKVIAIKSDQNEAQVKVFA